MRSSGTSSPNFNTTSQARKRQSYSARRHGIGGIGAVVVAWHDGSAQITVVRLMVRMRTYAGTTV